jgi:putative ABC transport system permease protein
VPDEAEFGAASHFIKFEGTEPHVLAADVAAAREAFDSVEVIHHREVPAPGLFEPVDYRAQDPGGPLSGPRLALLEGTYPAAGQVAITDGLADLFHLGIGASLTLDGTPRPVVGIVENPGNLGDEFALVPASQTGEAGAVTVLVDASDDQVNGFRLPSGAVMDMGFRMANADLVAAVTVLVLQSVALLLIALIAAASFVVVAHRRMRQLGMLAAIGATEKQLRLVTLANGTIIGLVAALAGAAIGFAGWVALAPLVEDAVGYRVAELDVPPWLVAGGMLLAVAAGTAAAWWPARNVARVPPVRALSGRPPEPRPARRAAALALVLALAGVACLATGGDVAGETAVDWTNATLLVAGTVAVALGMLLAGPPALRLLAACAGRLPIAIRLAVGDLARYRARAGSALAAISLAVGVAVAIVAAASAAQAAGKGNLPPDRVLIRAAHVDGPFIPEAAELDRLQAAAQRVAASFGEADVTSLDVALHPASRPDPAFDGREAMRLAKRAADMWVDLSPLYVATPRLLAHYGYELDGVPPGAVITKETGDLAILGDPATKGSTAGTLTNIVAIPPDYRSLPGTFVTAETVRERGWMTAPSGRWLVETAGPPTAGQLRAAREAAAGAGLTVEVRDAPPGVASLQSGVTLAGLLVALGVVAMTVGLVRSDAARDLHVLAATGATSGTRRTLTAATAAGLAVLGVVLGTAGAYLGLAASFARDLGALLPVPVAHLAVIVLGLPLLATAAGWLASGRAVADIARQPLQ